MLGSYLTPSAASLHNPMLQKRRKILYVITKSNFGGAQRYVFELATAMHDAGHDVTVAFGGTGVLKDKLTTHGVRTHTLPGLERDFTVRKELLVIRSLGRLIRDLQPDILHVNSSKASLWGALLGRVLGVPRIIFTAHGWPFFEHRSTAWRLIVWCLSYLTAILAHSVIVVSAHDLHARYLWGIHTKMRHIPIAVPNIPFLSRTTARQELQKFGARPPAETVLWIGTIAEYIKNKNLMTALHAVHALIKESPHRIFYTLIGIDGEERLHLEEYIRKHQLQDSIQLLGFIDNARTYLTAYDLFILPSLKEGLPYSLLEAGAAGCVCIGSRVGGIPEVIEDGETGLLFNPDKTSELITHLRTWLHDPTHLNNLGSALQEKICREYEQSVLIAKTQEVYFS